MGLIISIGGKAGSGKSTVAVLLARKLGFTHYSMGGIRRQMARERGMTIAELNRLGEREAFTDREPDEHQRTLGRTETDFVIDGRTSFHFIPHAVKVYLKAERRTRAERVFKDERKAEKFSSMQEAEQEIQKRDRSDIRRYRKYYGIDVNDPRHYDLVIDTTAITQAQVVEKIIAFLKQRRLLQGRRPPETGKRT